MQNRRKVRLGLKVIHRHRAGDAVFRRVSELVFVSGRPKAVLGWIDSPLLGGEGNREFFVHAAAPST